MVKLLANRQTLKVAVLKQIELARFRPGTRSGR